jgi:hypothetical protein
VEGWAISDPPFIFGSYEYFENFALFTKKGLNKRNVLHELYHGSFASVIAFPLFSDLETLNKTTRIFFLE